MTARSLLCRRVLCLPVLLLVAALAGAREPYGFRAGVFDDYLLALSWSPTYCLTHADDAGQCGASKGYGHSITHILPPACCCLAQRNASAKSVMRCRPSQMVLAIALHTSL